MAKKKADSPASDESIGFEEAMARVESIVERIESGEVGLEESLAEYERGVAMLRRCRTILERAELRVRELSSEGPAVEHVDGSAG